MNPDDEELTAEEQRVREALRALSAPAPDPEYRERMRREFRGAGDELRSRRPGRGWAIAASILLMAVGTSAFLANRSASWRLTSTAGSGSVRIDGIEVGIADASTLEAHLRPGALVVTDADVELEISSDDMLTLVVTPGSTVELPAVPGRWFGRRVSARLDRGELRGSSGERFPGARLEIELPDARVEVSGTTFAVIADGEGSCVCVSDGSVRMQDPTGTFGVSPGRRRVVPPGGGAARDEPIREMEAMKLEMLRERALELARAG